MAMLTSYARRNFNALLLFALGLGACESASPPPEPVLTLSETPPPILPPPPSSSEPQPAPTRPERDVSATDLRKVEVMDLVNQAIEMAREINPAAALVDVDASGLTSGTLNLLSRDSSDRPSMLALFEHKTHDSKLPPGKDTREGSLMISLRERRLTADQGVHIAAHLRLEGPIGSLPCPVSKAWRSAVAAGVPENAIARVALGRRRGSPDEWLFYVEGHDEYRRDVSAVTCSAKVAAEPKGSPITITSPTFRMPFRTPSTTPNGR